MTGSRVRKIARVFVCACRFPRMQPTTISYNSTNMKFFCVYVHLVGRSTVSRLRTMRLLIKFWQVSEYGNVACAFVCACSFCAREQKQHVRPSAPAYAPHEKREARTRMTLTEKLIPPGGRTNAHASYVTVSSHLGHSSSKCNWV